MPSITQRLTRPDAIAAFSHPVRRRIVLACAAEERATAELHRRLGIAYSTLHDHLRRLVAVGLLRVARTERRDGRPIRYYRASAPAYRISAHAMKNLPGADHAVELRAALDQAERLEDREIVFAVDAEGRTRMTLVSSERRLGPRALELWQILRLMPDQVATLQAEMTALAKRYALGSDRPSAKHYLIHFAMAQRRPPG